MFKRLTSTLDKMQHDSKSTLSNEHIGSYLTAQYRQDAEYPINYSSFQIHQPFLAPELVVTDNTGATVQTMNRIVHPQMESVPISVVRNPQHTIQLANVHITGEIGFLSPYIGLMHLLEIVPSTATVVIYIDSPGGYVPTGTMVASAIANSAASVITIARGVVASAAALIWSAGDTCYVEPFARLMFHMSSHDDHGNSLLVRDRAEHMVDYVSKCLLLDSVTKGHITQEEHDTIITNSTTAIWVSAQEMQSRLDRQPKEAAV